MLAFALLTGIALPAHSGGNGAPAFHTFGAINDPLSHGQVGDNLLSLNEAIQLHNQTLQYTQLSAAEQAQVLLIPGTGTQTFLSWARLDASVTPVITIEQDLDVIVNTNYGLFLSSDNGYTRFDFSGANITRGLFATTNSLQMRDIEFFGGPYGIDVVQTDISGQIGFAINDCRFVNHSQFGVRIRSATPNAFGKSYLERCEFEGCPTGMVFDESPASRTSFFDLIDCRFGGGAIGVDIALGDLGTGRYTLERVVIEASATGLQILRPNNATRPALLRMRHIEARAPTATVIECSPIGATNALIQMAHLWSTVANGTALELGDPLDEVWGTLEDSTFVGGVKFTAGVTSGLAVANLRCRDGAIEIGRAPQFSIQVIDSRFENCQVTTTGSGPVTLDNCCVSNSTITGTASSPINCVDSYVPNAGANVAVSSPRPAEQLGGMHVLPSSPTVGSTVTFEADLPAGLFGIFLLGFTDAFPQFPWPQPLHVYSQLGNTFLLPGTFRFQQQYLWPIPNNPSFVGLDMVAQIAVLPDPGISAQPVQLAPGRRFALQ